jgi:prepilin-type N-terminal cleavage/methylation domain-containing protein
MNYFKSQFKNTCSDFTRSVNFGDAFRSKRALRMSPKSTAGFTLIETLVALSIFTTSILAIMSVTPGGISAVDLSKNKTTASYLAQEGLDLIRAYRDDAKINVSATGLTMASAFIALTTACSSACYVDSSVNPVICVDGNGDLILDCPILFYDSTSGGFGYTVGAPSLFTRTITVNPSTNPDEYIITSKVAWGTNNLVSYQSSLTNWQ